MKKYKRNAKKRIFYNKKCYNCGNVDRFTIKEMRGLHFCQRCYKQHDTMSDVFANSVLELEKQNKRYREAIERALDESGWGDEGNALRKMISILAKALEGEEC